MSSGQGVLNIFVCREISDIKLRSSMVIRQINLYPYSKLIGRPLFVQSYASSGRIISIDVLEGMMNIINTRKNHITIIPDPKGKILDQELLDELSDFYFNGGDISILCPILSGYDARIFRYGKIRTISLGNYLVSSGEFLTRILINGIDRYNRIYIAKSGINKDSILWSKTPGTENYGRPASYKEESVPNWLTTGNDKLIQKNTLIQILDWLWREDFFRYLWFVYKYLNSIKNEVDSGRI